MSSESQVCRLCDQSLEGDKPTVQLRQKGSDGINAASKIRRDNICIEVGQRVHVECRRVYCNPIEIDKAIKQKPVEETGCQSPALRSTSTPYTFSTHCLFCGKLAKFEGRKRGSEVFPARTLELKDNIEKICNERNDEWAREVKSRLGSINDLPAADALYHQSCSVNFRTGKRIPKGIQTHSEKRSKTSGRPVNIVQETAFNEIIQHLQKNDDEQITLKELVEKMQELCGELAYTAIHMKRKLLEHFGSSVVIAEINGKNNVITFRNSVASILQSFYQRSKTKDSDSDKDEIIKTAAKLLLSDIKEIGASRLQYPNASNLMSVNENLDYVPASLRLFLRAIFSEKNADVKIASVGQAIIQAARPKVLMPPLQIGLGVQMHHHFASKFLIETLHKLGFSSPYSEVQRFEASAAVSQGTDLPSVKDGQLCQFVADNVDHNLRTIDGHNTFHGMGIIACFTPEVKVTKTVPRLSATADDIAVLGKIPVKFYKQENNLMLNETFEKLPDFMYEDPSKNIDLLSKCIWPMKREKQGWSGIMQMVQTGNHSGKSSIIFLPMIDMNPSDISCVYSTLAFVCKQAKQLNTVPVITFDQPLYWKALTILSNESPTSELKSLVLRLGGFHTVMSFLGCIGRLMEGSGLSELLQTVYAPNAVGHMMTGKSVSRATRAHFLLDEVLNALVVAKAYDISLNSQDNNTDEPLNLSDINNNEIEDEGKQAERVTLSSDSEDTVVNRNEEMLEIVCLFDELLGGEKTMESVCRETALIKLKEKIDEKRKSMCEYRTSKLWLMYMTMIDILRKFIKAERTGCWKLHLQTVTEMLPYLAAAGHNLYVKSLYMYLQMMSKLQFDHPDVFKFFSEGKHVVRRSDRFWAGLSTDLVIEQVLMRSVKTTGGLTRGRGMSETQRNQWLLSMPACTEYNSAMQEFSQISYHTSEQHKESSSARRERDETDKTKILHFLQDRSPFVEDKTLRNIETGVTAHSQVNVDSADVVGHKVIDTMVGENVLGYSFKRSNQAVTLGSKSTVKVDGEAIHIDPQLLFQRLTAAADRLYDNQAAIFKYELCSFPSSLFEPSGLMRPADKPALANAIWSSGDCSMQGQLDDSVKYVLDGGSLLQRLPWKYGDTFESICKTYVDHVTRKYAACTIVFDGYTDGPSTKDSAHQRRSRGIASPKVQFTNATTLRSKKEQFLANTENKQCFIDMLSRSLEEKGFLTVHALSDADVLIVKTAIASAENNDTVVVGEDTDLLVLLCFFANMATNKLYFISGASQKNVRTVKNGTYFAQWKCLDQLFVDCCHLSMQ